MGMEIIAMSINIVGCGLTAETIERLEHRFSDVNSDFILNIGNSEFEGKGVLNKADKIKGCIDKKNMFREFKRNGVNCLKFYDLGSWYGWVRALFRVVFGNKLVLRKGRNCKVVRLKGFLKNYGNYDYGTLFENKVFEYRVLVFKGNIFRSMIKFNPFSKKFRLCLDNTHFKDCWVRSEIEKESLKAVKCLGLDLAGVDVLMNDRFQFKVIEVNSGMGLQKESILRLKPLYCLMGYGRVVKV